MKKLGGLDSVGIAIGDDIEERVKQELADKLGKHRTEEITIESLHYNDCNEPWWTSISSYDTEVDQNERIREFISFIRYNDALNPIFVGHSLFFRNFYSKRVSNMLNNNRPELSSNMKKYRLSNATLMAVTLYFFEKQDGVDATILDCDLIFGGGFHGAEDDSHENSEESTGINTSTTNNVQSSSTNISSSHGTTSFSPLSDLINDSNKAKISMGIDNIKSITKKIIGGLMDTNK